MKRCQYLVMAATFAALLSVQAAGAQTQGACSAADDDREILYQVSTIDALMQGVYDSSYSFGCLKEHGDFGIGTFDALDGEMIAVDGYYYQIKSDGVAYPVLDNMTVPFACVTYFDIDQTVPIAHADNVTDFNGQLEEGLPSKNVFYAIRMDGVFPYIKARSVPRQAKPYPNLVDAVKNQTTFEFHNVSGTIVGFWSPDLAKGINVAGYHLHFINAERNAGGHVLDLRLNGIQARIDMTPNFSVALPTSKSFFNSRLTGGTQSDIERVEK